MDFGSLEDRVALHGANLLDVLSGFETLVEFLSLRATQKCL